MYKEFVLEIRGGTVTVADHELSRFLVENALSGGDYKVREIRTVKVTRTETVQVDRVHVEIGFA